MFAISTRPERPGNEHPDTFVRLPQQLGVLSLATVFRETALQFLNGSESWGKAELAMWLMGPYTRCTRYCRAQHEAGGVELPLSWRSIDARFVDRVIGIARTSVLDVFRSELSSDNVGAFASEMIQAGFVVRCADEQGYEGWLPTTKPRQLAERVLSLLAADCLARSENFALELSVCRACNLVTFDELARQRGICHQHQSGFFGRSAAASRVSNFPEGA